MRILLSADWHNGPEGLEPELKEFLRLPGDVRFALGDSLDFMAYRYKDYVGSRTVEELSQAYVMLLAGNHDALPYLSTLLPTKCYQYGWSLELRHPSLPHLRLEHGHVYTDWYLWRYLTPILLRVAPDLWVKLSRKPSRVKDTDNEAYQRIVHLCWSNALKRSRGKYIPAFGHTHCDRLLVGPGGKVDMVNVGSLKSDRTYVVVEDGRIEIKKLGE